LCCESLGIGTATPRANDIIAILYGCSVPIVIRLVAADDYHEVIGEMLCPRIHGWRSRKDNKIKWKDREIVPAPIDALAKIYHYGGPEQVLGRRYYKF
jgi:hypothetical protein